MNDVCADFGGQTRGSRGVSKVVLENIFVNDDRKVMCCLVAKVACSTWKYIMINSTGNISHVERKSVPVHSRDYMRKIGLHTLADYSEKEIESRLNTYYKFMVVRHPFDRLSSAFREKFGIKNTYYHNAYGKNIIKKYRKDATQKEIDEGKDVRFDEFVNYILDSNPDSFNDHWKRYYDVCDPCRIQYNKIVKLETIEEDSKEVLPMLGLSADTLMPTTNMNKEIDSYSIENGKSLSYVYDKLSPQLTDKLRGVYAWDFRIFGYTWDIEKYRATCHNRKNKNTICC